MRALNKSHSVCVCVHKSSDARQSKMSYKRDNRGIVHLLAGTDSNTDVWQLGEDEQRSDASQALCSPPGGL